MATMDDDLVKALMDVTPGQGHVERLGPEPKAQPVRGYERTRPASKRHKPTFDYDAFTMRAAGLAALLIWGILWIADGYFTASFVSRITGASVWIGAVVHVVISLVQQHLWRRGWREHWMLIVPISVVNIGTTLIGLWAWVASLTKGRPFAIFDMMDIIVPQSVIWFWLVVAGGVAMAILPERKASQAAHELF